jgi:hypothetical protein
MPLDSPPNQWTMYVMVAETLAAGISPEFMAELQVAADRAAKGVRNPIAMRQASDDMDRIREEIRREHGILDIGVPAIRELRDT